MESPVEMMLMIIRYNVCFVPKYPAGATATGLTFNNRIQGCFLVFSLESLEPIDIVLVSLSQCVMVCDRSYLLMQDTSA